MRDLKQYNQSVIFGAYNEVLFVKLKKVYSGVGLGAYIKSATTNRISSKFTFAQRLFIGYRITNKISVEISVRHFSNGTLTELNSGQNFANLSFHTKF